MARPVADFDGAIAQLLLPSAFSLDNSSPFSTAIRIESERPVRVVALVMRTLWVASVNILSTSFGKHGLSPSGLLVSHAGSRPTRTPSYFSPFWRSVVHTV